MLLAALTLFSESDDESVLPEAKDYVEENDGRYHADWIDGRYLLPSDEQKQERLDLQHDFVLDKDGLHKAPLQGSLKVFDVGTGTGKWAIAFAEAHPSAVVTAVDISPNVMPTWTHPNCELLALALRNYSLSTSYHGLSSL